jgi:general secretion pathway protein H
MADPRGRMGDDADKFGGRVRAARDSAIINAGPVALWVSATGYGFDKWKGGRWEPVQDGPLATRDWSKNTRAEVGSNGRLRAIFDTVGRADQTLDFALNRDDRAIHIRMDMDGKVVTGD